MMNKKIISMLMVGMLSSSLLVGCKSTQEVIYEDEKFSITMNEAIKEEGEDGIVVEVTVENKTNETILIKGTRENGTLNGEEIICNFSFSVEPYEIIESDMYFCYRNGDELTEKDLVKGEVKVFMYDFMEINEPKEVELNI